LEEGRAQLQFLATRRDGQRATLQQGHKAFDADTLRATYAHLAYLDRAIEDQHVRVEACEAEFARAQAKLLAASKDRKVLETLKTRRREAHDSALAQADQRTLDDQNARLFGRTQLQRGQTS
ncbi:MAG: flagellar export protein FliJ, partial [Candidatus Velthaea sp.]